MELFTSIPKLFIGVTENEKVCENDVLFNYADIPKLMEYLPYHDDVDVEGRLATISEEVDVSGAGNNDENDDPFIVETICLIRDFIH